MKKKYVLNFILILFLCLGLSSQNPYYFSVDSGTYTDLSGSTSASNNMIWDDPVITFPLGFTFEIFGASSDSLYMNGFLGIILTFDQFSSGTSPLLVPYMSDLADRGWVGNISMSPISYKTEGSPGSRIFKAEWKNAGFYYEMATFGTNRDFVNIQVWLYEGSNDMEIHFGPNNIENFNVIHTSSGPLVGYIDNFNGPLFSYDKMWFLSGDPTSPTVDSTYGIDPTNALNATIPSGTIYRFSTTFPTSIKDLSIEREVNIYPSIVQNDFVIQFLRSDFNEAMIQTFDSNGKLVDQQWVTDHIVTKNVQNLVPGIYFIHVKTKGGETVKKIIKQ